MASPRYRLIIDAYRQALLLRDPAMCRTIDGRMEESGEGWVCDDGPVDVNQWMSAKAISERFGIPSPNIYYWYGQNPESIQRVKKDGRVVFWLADILRHQAQKPSR